MTGTILFGFFVEKIEIVNASDPEDRQQVMVVLRRVPNVTVNGKPAVQYEIKPESKFDDDAALMKTMMPVIGSMFGSFTALLQPAQRNSQIILSKREFDEQLPKLRVGDVIDLQLVMRGDED